MESVGAMSESEWSSFSDMYSNEESEFLVQLLNNCSTPNDFHGGSSFPVPSFWPDHESMNMAGVDIGSINSLDNTNINVNRLSVGSTGYNDGSSFLFPTSSHDSYYTSDCNQILWTNNDSAVLDYCIGEAKVTNSPGQVCTNNLLQGDDFLNQDMSNDIMEESGGNLPKADILEKGLQLENEAQLPEPEPSNEVELKNTMQKSKKRCCNLGDVQKNKRNVKSRKKQKLNSISKNEEDKNSAIPMENLSSYCSEDDSNAFHELNGGVTSTSDSKGAVAVNTSGKTRVNRGSATDPQSLYARKRRERINERLKTLQNLVPNGTKVDISTMLEEAVQYVKFLQLQIKLLSSDDLWMYAPIAYNGMNLGLDMKITMPR